MKVENKKSSFNRIVSRVMVLGALLSVLMVPWSVFAAPQNDGLISCGEFVAMMAQHQPENPLFPKGSSQFSKEELYLQTVQSMSAKGFHVLDKKSFHDPLEANEFVQVSYAFADGPLGKNLFEQKLFLKESGVIDSADVGLTTAYDGNVYQTHRDKSVATPVRLATPVYMHDHIKTDLLSKATFTFDDKSALTLAEDSNVNITKHIYDPEKDLRQTIVHLSRGTVRFVVTKGKAQGSMFKVITPTAIAGVRGTEFIVDVGLDGETTFLVLEGQIETRLPGARAGDISLISAGESQNVSKNGVAAQVRQAAPGLMRASIARTSPPGLTMANKGLSKKVVRAKVQKLMLVKKFGKDKGMKANVLKMAKHTALVDAKTLGKKFERIKGEKFSKLTPRDSGKANAKVNAQINARANARANARQVAQESSNGKSMMCIKTGKC